MDFLPKMQSGEDRSGGADIPLTIDGWTMSPDTSTYDRRTIYEYIDGAAEVYLLYDFRAVRVREFTHPKHCPITVEIFNMNSAADAFGIFSFYHGGEDVECGQGAYYRPGLLSFHQNKYFVTVGCDDTTAVGKTSLLQIGHGLQHYPSEKDTMPWWFKEFPREDMVLQSLRFFHTHHALNYHYYLHEDNILNLDMTTDCLLARYSREEIPFTMLWIHYPSGKSAREAKEAFEKIFPSNKHHEDIGWTAAGHKQDFLAIVLGAESELMAGREIINAELELRKAIR